MLNKTPICPFVSMALGIRISEDPTSKFYGFRKRYRSALPCYTQQLYTILRRCRALRATIASMGGVCSRTRQFQECAKVLRNFEIGFPFRNWLAISQFLICAAQFRNCVNLQIAQNIYIVQYVYVYMYAGNFALDIFCVKNFRLK